MYIYMCVNIRLIRQWIQWILQEISLKRENFHMKNADSAFYYIKQFGYLSLHIGGNRASVELFRLFSIYLKDQAFKYLKNQAFFGDF